MIVLYHVSGWGMLGNVSVGDTFTLVPGTQCAEGVGVYFAEGIPRISAAEGACGNPSAIVSITTSESGGWWQSKAAKARKFGKPRTWHSNKKHVKCTATSVTVLDNIPVLHCTWEWDK